MSLDLHQSPSGVTKNSSSGSCVFLIDNDASLRAALKELFESVGLHVEFFASGSAFLENRPPESTNSCLVLDARLPGMSGLRFQEELTRAEVNIPIIFLTGHGDIPMAVRAMKAGAVDFLTKPFRNQDLLDAVSTALDQDRARRAKEQSSSTLRESFDSLSARERDVLAGVTAGRLNKQIAADLGVSEVTVKVHRAKAMRKLRVKSVQELVRMTDLLGVTPLGHGLGKPGREAEGRPLLAKRGV
jgi:RNA polymerase sigma factor (sigma-70 family)